MQENGKEWITVKQKQKGVFSGVLAEAALYAAVFLVTLLLFLLLKPYYEHNGTRGAVAQTVVAVVIGCLSAAGVYLKFLKKLDTRALIILILAAGLTLRIGTMLCTPAGWYTPSQMLQMDTYTRRSDGHEGYAWRIFTTGTLPDTNDYQFYHPPLNALFQAGFMRFMSGLEKGLVSLGAGSYFPGRFLAGQPDWIEAERYFLYSSCQILAVMYSFAVCILSLKILRLFGAEGWTLAALAAFMVFYPRGIQFSGALNNDGIAYMFSVFALYFALKWWKQDKSFVNILLCALGVGLGMMSKLSSATICLPIAGIFIYEFVRTLKRKSGALFWGNMIAQYTAFLALCVPLGLWFQVYAYVRFGQPFGYVFSNLNQALSTAHRSWFERFFPVAFDAHEYFDSLWCHVFGWNYNLFHFALRSSIFGEFNQYSRGESFAAAAVVFAYIAVVLLIVATLVSLYLFFRYDRKRKDHESGEAKRNLFFTALLVVSQVFSEIYFYIKMPYACTMDFRYIMPLILGMCLTLCFALGRLKREGGRFSLALCRSTAAAVGAFLLFSALFYMTFI